MGPHDLRSYITPVVAITSGVISADNTPANIDLSGYKRATILLVVGAGGITFSGTNKIEFKLRHGSSTTASEHTAVALKDVEGVAAAEITDDALTSGIIKSLIAEHAAEAIYTFDYVGGENNISILADFSGTHGTGTKIGAIVLKSRPDFTANVAAADLKA